MDLDQLLPLERLHVRYEGDAKVASPALDQEEAKVFGTMDVDNDGVVSHEECPL